MAPHLIDGLKFVFDGKLSSAAIDSADNQIVVTVHNARE